MVRDPKVLVREPRALRIKNVDTFCALPTCAGTEKRLGEN